HPIVLQCATKNQLKQHNSARKVYLHASSSDCRSQMDLPCCFNWAYPNIMIIWRYATLIYRSFTQVLFLVRDMSPNFNEMFFMQNKRWSLYIVNVLSGYLNKIT